MRASTVIPNRESVVNPNGSLGFTTRTVTKTRFPTRLDGEVKDFGFQKARTGPTVSVSLLTTESTTQHFFKSLTRTRIIKSVTRKI